MFPQNDTLNSFQNSTINITQLLATATTTNRRSRFLSPVQANPAQEDEDIYVSLQLLQAQLGSRTAPRGSQELLERVLSKVEKLQTTVNTFSENYDFVRRTGSNGSPSRAIQTRQFSLQQDLKKQEENRQKRDEAQALALKNTIAGKDAQLEQIQAKHREAQKDIVYLQKELEATKIRSNEEHQNAILGLQQQVERLQFQISQQNTLQQQIEALCIKVNQHDQFEDQIQELQQKVNQFESIRQEKIELEEKCRIEQNENNQLLRRNCMLESENNKLKETVAKMMQEKEEPEHDTILFPVGTDTISNIRDMLEREQMEKTHHASRGRKGQRCL